MNVKPIYNNLRIAAFFDCENFSSKYVDFIIERLEKHGNILSIQAFKDWSVQSDWSNEICMKYPIEPIHTIRYNGKNSTDLRMQRAILECLYAGGIADCIAIASSDSDFRDLVLHIKALGKISIGIGRANVGLSLQNIHNVFIALPNTTTQTENKNSPQNINDTQEKNIKTQETNNSKPLQQNKTEQTPSQLHIAILKQAMQIAKRDFPKYVQDGWIAMNILANTLKSMNPSYNKKFFKTSSYGKLFCKEPYNKHFEIKKTGSTLKIKLK